jgi:2-dehydropantoate 2-reductase
VTVKSQDLDGAMSAASPHLGDCIVASIQNGINDQTLERFIAPSRLVMGMTATNMAILEPGAVSLQLDGATVVGPSPQGTNAAAARAVADLLKKTALQVVEHPNVLGVRYNKLAINALGYASCISNSNFITEAICFGPWREVVGRPIVEECLAIFGRAGIGLAKIPGRPDVGGLARLLRLLDTPLLGSAVAAGARRLYNKKPIVFSLTQDLRRGKATEVDYINGQIVRLAERHGLSAPCNALVVELVHQIQRRGPSGFLAREEVIQRFRRREGPGGA